MAKYKHPILLLSKTIDEDGSIKWEGSGRSFDTANFQDLRTFIKDSGYAFLAEGHSNAFGVGFEDDKISDFIAYSNEVLKDYIGHIEETAKYDGNVGLAAHNRGNEHSYFARINELELGDEIIYKTKFEERKYNSGSPCWRKKQPYGGK